MRRLGKYILEAPLGRGGIASLWRARHEATGGEVAVKLLEQAHREDRVTRMRFFREAQTLASLAHPGVVRVHEVAEDGADVFMVLELLHGESLQERIAREAPFPIPRAITIADRILTALGICHENGVVHRDLKPSNVMLLEDDHVKLIDFGLAKVGPDVAEKLTETGTVHGTPHYMSPEQCRGEDVGPASDIYSVGVLLHEMLAGKTPFAGSDAATLMAAHLFVDPPALANVPAGLAAVVRSALAKRPEDRPSAGGLRIALADAVRGADPVTRRGADAETRVGELAKPREERAIGSAGASTTGDVRGGAVLWMANDARAASLLSCLGTAGIDTKIEESDDVPLAVGVVIVARIDRLRSLRERDRKRPAIVTDVSGPNATAEAIRAGADDMLLREAPDADVVAKVQRLLRRKTRT